MDGRLLAQAREEKKEIYGRSVAEDDRRHRAAYRRVPELQELDGRLVALIAELSESIAKGGRSVEEIRDESLALQARRAELLVENGWPSNWLDGAWDCPKCKDSGFVEGRPCGCLMKLYEKARSRELSALLKLGDESFDAFDLSYYDSVPGAREHMEAVWGFCRDYAAHFGRNSVNLLLRGDTGLGKTYLSACIAREVSSRGWSVVYETTVAAIAAYEEQKFRGSEEAEGKIRQLLTCDLLILDDLGTEMITEFSKSALYTLINGRLLADKKTIVSTNLPPEELERVYTPQIASRLQGEYQDLPFVGRDIRLQKKERGLG